MSTSQATFSTFLRNPNEVLEQLDAGDVVLVRRDGAPLRLSKEIDAQREEEMVAAFAQLIAAVVLDEESADRVAERLSVPFAWIEFLNTEERRDFVGEFLRTARACASLGRFDKLSVVVGAWRETALAHSIGLRGDGANLDYIPGGLIVDDPRLIS